MLTDMLLVTMFVVAVIFTVYACSRWIPDGETRAPSACAPTAIEGELRCVFPTEGRPAIVFVYPYEDGSAKVLAVDPDGRYKVP